MSNTELKFAQEIQQMMHIAGETRSPSLQTISLVEDIVKQQVVFILTTANDLAARRGSRLFSNYDLIFQFRHDDSRVARLRSLLAWKNIRKNVKDSDDEKGAKFDAVTVENPAIDQVAANAAENPSEAKTTEPMTTTLPWDIASYYSERTPNDAGMFVLDKTDGGSLERLRQADKKTEGMTIQEYTAWSEYRHASFTWRKTKRFREWSGLGVIAEHKPSDDVLEILGFLTADMVQRLTEMALAMQKLEQPSGPSRPDSTVSMAEKPASLFVSPDDTDPIHPRHIHQAFQNIQAWSRKKQPTLSRRTMGAGRGLMLI